MIPRLIMSSPGRDDRERLRVEFAQSGGIVGGSWAVSLDAAELPEQEARELERLVREADLWKSPTVRSPPSRHRCGRVRVRPEGDLGEASPARTAGRHTGTGQAEAAAELPRRKGGSDVSPVTGTSSCAVLGYAQGESREAIGWACGVARGTAGRVVQGARPRPGARRGHRCGEGWAVLRPRPAG